MMPSTEQRIEQAWKHAKGWVVEFNGAPTAALLLNAPTDAVSPAIEIIATSVENLRITVIPAEKPSEARFIPLEAVADQIQQLFDNRTAELSANWALSTAAFDLDLHLIVHPLQGGRVSLQVDWWSDQVFSKETENRIQFIALMNYFIELQQRFQAATLFLSSESSLDPSAADDAWVEI